MTTDKNLIQQTVADSRLSGEDKELWEMLLVAINDQQAQAMAGLLTAQPDKLTWLNQNLKSKIEALLTCDQNAWDKIVNQEVALIASQIEA